MSELTSAVADGIEIVNNLANGLALQFGPVMNTEHRKELAKLKAIFQFIGHGDQSIPWQMRKWEISIDPPRPRGATREEVAQ